MVSVEEVNEESQPAPSEERLRDAEEIEAVALQCKRATAKMHLTSLAKKLRKESEALKRIEESQKKSPANGEQSSSSTAAAAEAPKASAPVAAAPVNPPKPVSVSVKAIPPPASSSVKYTSIDSFAFDAGEYNSPFVTLYISLPGVGSIDRSQVDCKFGTSNFDLIVQDLRGKSYRLVKTNLEKDIVPDKSKIIVKADKVIIKLAKVKGEYGSYDYWSKLTDPKRGDKTASKKSSDPSSSIMDLMKDMYDSGDDQMRKMIGETMMKQQRGELGKDAGMGMGGLGGMDDDDV